MWRLVLRPIVVAVGTYGASWLIRTGHTALGLLLGGVTVGWLIGQLVNYDRAYRARWRARFGYEPRPFPWPYVQRPCPQCPDTECNGGCDPEAKTAREIARLERRARERGRSDIGEWN